MCFLRVEKSEETLTTDTLGILLALPCSISKCNTGLLGHPHQRYIRALSPGPLCQPWVSQKDLLVPSYFLKDLKEKKEVVEEAENGRDAPANGNAVSVHLPHDP